MRYEVKTPRSTYTLESNDVVNDILKKEKISFKEIQESTLGKLIFLKQGDSSWGNVTIGNTSYTLGKFGCLITSISMLTYWYGKYITPDKLAKSLSFTQQGELYWNSIDEVCPFTFVYRYYRYDKTKLLQILTSKDNAAVVRVPYAGASHWLVLIGYNYRGWKCIDPLRGDVCYASRYGNINGFAEVSRK